MMESKEKYTTEAVLERHLDAFGSQDMEGIIADYSPDGLIITQAGAFEGKGEIEQLFAGFFKEFSEPGHRSCWKKKLFLEMSSTLFGALRQHATSTR